MSKRGKLVVKRSPLVVRGNIDDDMPLPAPCTMRARFQAGPASPGGDGDRASGGSAYPRVSGQAWGGGADGAVTLRAAFSASVLEAP